MLKNLSTLKENEPLSGQNFEDERVIVQEFFRIFLLNSAIVYLESFTIVNIKSHATSFEKNCIE
jgi:hypothetical protein